MFLLGVPRAARPRDIRGICRSYAEPILTPRFLEENMVNQKPNPGESGSDAEEPRKSLPCAATPPSSQSKSAARSRHHNPLALSGEEPVDPSDAHVGDTIPGFAVPELANHLPNGEIVVDTGWTDAGGQQFRAVFCAGSQAPLLRTWIVDLMLAGGVSENPRFQPVP